MNIDQIEIGLLFEGISFSTLDNLESLNYFEDSIAAPFSDIFLSSLLIVVKHNIAFIQDTRIILLGTADNGIRQYS
jgi:hypothetical protein